MSKCELCGQDMPTGEEVFKYHGYSGPCPLPVITNWKYYKRKGHSEMRPYIIGEDISHVSISEADKMNNSPKEGDMIARNPKNHDDQWLVAKKYFEDNLELI